MMPDGIRAPIAPMMIPSITKGERTKKSVAPIYFIMAISSLLTEIPMVTVFEIRKIDTKRSIAIMPIDT